MNESKGARKRKYEAGSLTRLLCADNNVAKFAAKQRRLIIRFQVGSNHVTEHCVIAAAEYNYTPPKTITLRSQ